MSKQKLKIACEKCAIQAYKPPLLKHQRKYLCSVLFFTFHYLHRKLLKLALLVEGMSRLIQASKRGLKLFHNRTNAFPLLRCLHTPTTNDNSTQKTMNTDRVTSILSQLDNDNEKVDKGRGRAKTKLNKSLVKPAKRELDDASRGIQEALGEDLAQTMNEYLQENALFRTRKNLKNSSSDSLVEITTVSLNKDESHAHAYWTSEPVLSLLTQMIQNCTTMDTKRNYEVALRVEKNVSARLQRFEGKFRSNIIRTINMRRVPRIFFAADASTKLLIEKLKSMKDMTGFRVQDYDVDDGDDEDEDNKPAKAVGKNRTEQEVEEELDNEEYDEEDDEGRDDEEEDEVEVEESPTRRGRRRG